MYRTSVATVGTQRRNLGLLYTNYIGVSVDVTQLTRGQHAAGHSCHVP